MKRFFQILTVAIALLSIYQTVSSHTQAQAKSDAVAGGPHEPNI